MNKLHVVYLQSSGLITDLRTIKSRFRLRLRYEIKGQKKSKGSLLSVLLGPFINSIISAFGKLNQLWILWGICEDNFLDICSLEKIFEIVRVNTNDPRAPSGDSLSKLFLRITLGSLIPIKSSFSEKATKIWKNLPLVLTLVSRNSCFVKTDGRFFSNFLAFS